MTDQNSLLQLVPIGEENAASARSIWGIERLGSPSTLKAKLNQLARERLIERKLVAVGQNWRALYFRND